MFEIQKKKNVDYKKYLQTRKNISMVGLILPLSERQLKCVLRIGV